MTDLASPSLIADIASSLQGTDQLSAQNKIQDFPTNKEKMNVPIETKRATQFKSQESQIDTNHSSSCIGSRKKSVDRSL